jgi:aminodeoxyfutalosine deaminase
VSAWIAELPKAELHVHLEGSITAETLREIDSGLSVEKAAEGYRYGDFPGFLKSFAFVATRLREPGHYALAARRMFERLAAQKVRHVEVTVSAGVLLWKALDVDRIFSALFEEGRRADLAVRWHVDAVRQWGPVAAWPVVEFAAATKGVTSFGLGGNEGGGPARWFRGHFEYARRHGLRLTCHAGEADGPASIWDALAIGAERIGHGVRAIEDPVLVRHLADRGIPLEISVTSNIRTGVIASWTDHPIRRLYEAGVPIVINSDDPALFGSELSQEYELLGRLFGFTQAEVEGLAGNGFRFAFTERV